jgi:uncharacterized protein YdeI (YjbR/CyaY-like superfamily)
MEPRFFATPDDFRGWLKEHHATATELLVGFHKKRTGRASMTWTESVREALCFGWIDGIRRSLGDESYTIRFTPRRPGSVWSSINVRHVEELIREGRMTRAGLAAYEARKPERTGIYAFEQRHSARLAREDEERFRADATALGVLPGTTAFLPPDRRLLGRQRKTKPRSRAPWPYTCG